ncbi:transcriptional regulator [Skermanella stibiiresistens SB22]|uniref:Pyruvate dehydrogenase complex repressor n=1 Tax=Skermanella stibiiresistens SB22 TaxID=1385369 RepID=W9GYE2_9PROT|nr:transcriptional regulator [Skermanella stibiiresistens SB22]
MDALNDDKTPPNEETDRRTPPVTETSAAAEPVAKAGTDRVSDRVATKLLDRIAKGELTPGQRLPGERQLAEQMGVSRVSVRAALQQLKTQGFLAAVQGGGTRVLSTAGDMDGALSEMIRVKFDNLYDLADIRVILESWAARRAAINATPEQVAEIGRTVVAMAQPSRGKLRANDDVDFHIAIGKAAGSPVYMHILSVIRDTLTQMLEFHRHELFDRAEDKIVLAQHRAIHRAIDRRDPDAAAAAMTAHLTWVLDHYHAARRRRESADVPAPEVPAADIQAS